MGDRIILEYRETDETISLKVFHGTTAMQQHFLDADDDRWELILPGDGTSTLLTATNGDFER